MKHRCFIALETPDAVHASLCERLASFARGTGINWVKPENLHLTLLFLGDVEDRQIKDMEGVLADISAAAKPVRMAMQGLELFPARDPRLVWATLTAADDAVFHLHKSILRASRELNIDADAKALKLHITLGRVKSPQNPAFEAQILSSAVDAGEHDYTRLTLFRSVLKPDGPVYHPLYTYELNYRR